MIMVMIKGKTAKLITSLTIYYSYYYMSMHAVVSTYNGSHAMVSTLCVWYNVGLQFSAI